MTPTGAWHWGEFLQAVMRPNCTFPSLPRIRRFEATSTTGTAPAVTAVTATGCARRTARATLATVCNANASGPIATPEVRSA